MSLTTCESCEKEFLTEADPYVVLPKPSGTIIMCLKCATRVAHRAAEESAKDAHRRGWEQAKGEAVEVAKQTIFPPPKSYYTLGREDAAKAIAAMEYKGPAK